MRDRDDVQKFGMESRVNGLTRLSCRSLIAAMTLCIVAVAVPQAALGQAAQLSAEQRRMLDQLPPIQRQQALRALRELQGRGGSGADEFSDLDEEFDPFAAFDREDDEIEEPSSEPRAESHSQLVVSLIIPEDAPSEETAVLEEDSAVMAIVGARYYELDAVGVLRLPGIADVPLLGLTEEQIELRLGAEPALRLFDITANLIDTERVGVQALEPFGYDVFESEDYEFRPVTTGPVSADYVLGPGDSIRVQLFGNVNEVYEYEVSRDGVLNLPDIGPMTVAGLPFSEFRRDVGERVQQMLIGTQVSVTMGELRTIRVFVLGDANRPGSYVVSGLATVSSALYRSGGISRIGSLRDIQLKRNGELVSRFDLYDLLLSGDTSADSRLQPGDVIFIPPVGAQVSVDGAVKRPAIYETRPGDNVADVLAMAGGLNAEAFPDGARVERIDERRERTVVALDADGDRASTLSTRAGDVIIVPEVLPDFQDTVVLSGHVHRPGPYEWRADLRLSDVVGSSLELKFGADTDYVLIRREVAGSRAVHVLSANLTRALSQPQSDANVVLRPRDEIFVFDRAFDRQRIIEPILEQLELQSKFGTPNPIVSVSGQVNAPGTYPMEPGMRISDLIRAGGNLAEEAFSLKAELVRYAIVNNEYRNTEVIDVDLGALLRGEEVSDLVLAEHDDLRISGLPEWDSLWTVSLEGEVRFPGQYRIRRGETLAQLLERAGGLTDSAFAEGAVFLRESLREREQQQIELLARRLEADITTLSLETAETSGREALSTGRELLAQLRETEAVGRLVIDLDGMAATERVGVTTLELRDGDQLLVPKTAQEVTVIGETQQNTSHLYQPGLSRDAYIDMSGGLTRRADRKLIYVVRASGAVVTAGRSKWFGRVQASDIRPGDTIVVPLETDRIRPLTFWTNVTQILYQAAIAVAAVETFNN